MSHFGFKLLRSFSRLFGGKGLGRLPFATALYQFFYGRVRPEGIVEVTAQGKQFLVNSSDTALAPYLIMRGVYAADETALLKRILKPSMTYIDVGANIGYFSVLASDLVGETGKVIAFEPDEANFKLLEKNIALNRAQNITAVKKGLSDTIGTARFYLNEKNLCSHTMVPREGDRVVEIETATLDRYLNGDSADVIKLDVEGAEPLALAGMQKTILENQELILLTEFFPEALRRGGFDPKKYLDDLLSLGFILYRVEGGDPVRLSAADLPALARGEKIRKLTYLLCTKP